ncbi:MAG: hypothetical protein OEX14_00745, partial [Paracoccaceae bacterium]|nr:hypothetical protein [Paracoccaceae bacterium]
CDVRQNQGRESEPGSERVTVTRLAARSMTLTYFLPERLITVRKDTPQTESAEEKSQWRKPT